MPINSNRIQSKAVVVPVVIKWFITKVSIWIVFFLEQQIYGEMIPVSTSVSSNRSIRLTIPIHNFLFKHYFKLTNYKLSASQAANNVYQPFDQQLLATLA